VHYSGGKIVQSFRGVLANMSLHDVSLTESTSQQHIESRSAVTIRYLWVEVTVPYCRPTHIKNTKHQIHFTHQIISINKFPSYGANTHVSAACRLQQYSATEKFCLKTLNYYL